MASADPDLLPGSSHAPSALRHTLALVLSSMLVLFTAAILILGFFVHWDFESPSFHSTIEATGSLICQLPALLFIVLRDEGLVRRLGMSIISGLAVMGVFNFYQALSNNVDTLVWLHSLGIFTGGWCFALNWRWQSQRSPSLPILLSLILFGMATGIFSWLLPEFTPAMVGGTTYTEHASVVGATGFTTLAIVLNVAGGLLFLIGGASYVKRFCQYRDDQELLLGLVSVCFAISGLVFPFTHLWSDVWWYRHLMTYAGFAILVFIFLYNARVYFDDRHRVQVLLDAISDNANAGFYAKDPEGRYLFVNRFWSEIFGLKLDQVVGFKDDEVFPSSAARIAKQNEALVLKRETVIEFEQEIDWGSRGGSFLVAKFPLRAASQRLLGSGGIYWNISDQLALREQLEQATHFDVLTALPNRSLMRDRLQQGIELAQQSNSHLAVLALDIDNFKLVNDSIGYNAGDELLVNLATRLSPLIKGGDTLARVGADEFVIIVNTAGNDDELAAFVERLVAAAAEPVSIGDTIYHAHLSVGIARFPTDGSSVEKLIQHADTARYDAKSKGGSTYQFYDRELTSQASRELQLHSDLTRALENNEFELYWQPQVNLNDGALLGAEALIRWNAPEAGQMQPGFFLPFAESHDLMGDIGRWVMQNALKQIGQWADYLRDDLSFSINLNPAELTEPEFSHQIIDWCTEYSVPPKHIILEVTEQDVITSLDIGSRHLTLLRDHHFRLSIDDFGTGSSSLLRLKQYPFQELKIDQRFVRDLPNDCESAAIIEATLVMAKALEISVIAEGIETDAQAQAVKDLGCQRAQGFLFAKPMSASKFEQRWLKK